jgi:16S rRNA processing protein RimM
MQSGVAVVLSLEGLASRESAEEVSGLAVWAEEDALPPLEDDEVFVSDLVGLEVHDSDGRRAGVVSDVLDLPAQCILVVRRDAGGDALVPFVPGLIESVDESRIVVRDVEGLLDPDGQEEAA